MPEHPQQHDALWVPDSRAFFECRHRTRPDGRDPQARHRSHRWVTVLGAADAAGTAGILLVRHDDGVQHAAYASELLTDSSQATLPGPAAHPDAPAVVYEVGPDDEPAHPGYHVTNYTVADQVPPATFGMAVRRWPEQYPAEVDMVRFDPPRVQHIPLALVWGTQEYVYAPHVRNLATVPADVLEMVEGRWHGDGTFETDDHHRVAAALLRGDTHIRALVSGAPVPPVTYDIEDVACEVGWDNGSCHDPVGPDAVATLERIPVPDLAHWASPDPRTWRQHWPMCASCDARLQAGEDPAVLADDDHRCAGHCEGPYLSQMLAHLRQHAGFGDLPPVVAFHRPAEKDLPVDDGHHRISMATFAELETVPGYLFHENGCCLYGLLSSPAA